MRALFFLTLALVVLPSAARAQETGGSVGGGSFDEEESASSSGSSSSGSSFGSSSSSAGLSFDSSSGTTTAGATPLTGTPLTLAILLTIGFVVVAVLIYTSIERRRAAETQREVMEQMAAVGPVAPMRAFSAATDVAVVSLAIDWRARRFVQSTFARLAKESDTRSKQGLAKLLAESARTLLAVETAWLYGAALNALPMKKSDAAVAFNAAVSDARARFHRDVVRNENGVVTTQDAGALRAKPTEGEGVVVVTVVAAARRELVDVRAVRDARELKRLLTQLTTLGGELVATEIVWSPAAEDDRMSTLELEAIYPDLIKLDEASLVGRVFCAYCHGPYPRELGACPHCGAPGVPSS